MAKHVTIRIPADSVDLLVRMLNQAVECTKYHASDAKEHKRFADLRDALITLKAEGGDRDPGGEGKSVGGDQ